MVCLRGLKVYIALLITFVGETRRYSSIVYMFFFFTSTHHPRSERNTVDNLSLRSNQDSESISFPWRRNRLSVLIDVSFLDGISEKDITRNIPIDEAGVEATDGMVRRVPMV